MLPPGTVEIFQHRDQAHQARIGDPVVHRLRFAPALHQPVVAQPRQVLRKRRRAEPDLLRQRARTALAPRDQRAQDQQAAVVAQRTHQPGGFCGAGTHLVQFTLSERHRARFTLVFS